MGLGGVDMRALRREDGRLGWQETLDRDGIFLLGITTVATLGLGAVAVMALSGSVGLSALCALLALAMGALAACVGFVRRGWELDPERRTARSWRRGLGRTREELHRFDELEAVEVWKQGGVVGGTPIVTTCVGLVGDDARLVLAATTKPYEASELAREVSSLTGLPIRELEG